LGTTVNDSLRAARADARALRDAARAAARHAREAGNAEVEKLITDVEELIGQLDESLEPQSARVRAGFTEAVGGARRAIADGATQARRRAGEALAASEGYVRGRPWGAVGAAAIAGLVLGVLAFRR
jgi:ElaB/YqjD/DUF883 family membrane-anchored ribosome-binding protein